MVLPPPDAAADMDKSKPWVQAFEVPRGEVIFNHLTAGLQLELSTLVDISSLTHQREFLTASTCFYCLGRRRLPEAKFLQKFLWRARMARA